MISRLVLFSGNIPAIITLLPKKFLITSPTFNFGIKKLLAGQVFIFIIIIISVVALYFGLETYKNYFKKTI